MIDHIQPLLLMAEALSLKAYYAEVARDSVGVAKMHPLALQLLASADHAVVDLLRLHDLSATIRCIDTEMCAVPDQDTGTQLYFTRIDKCSCPHSSMRFGICKHMIIRDLAASYKTGVLHKRI